jgi:enoyl-CoA hydratase/carnithine racemase
MAQFYTGDKAMIGLIKHFVALRKARKEAKRIAAERSAMVYEYIKRAFTQEYLTGNVDYPTDSEMAKLIKGAVKHAKSGLQIRKWCVNAE